MGNISITTEPDSAPVTSMNSMASLHINRSCEFLFIIIKIFLFIFSRVLVSSNASVISSTISSIDVLGEDLTNQKFGRLYRRWLKIANQKMKQTLRQVKKKRFFFS